MRGARPASARSADGNLANLDSPVVLPRAIAADIDAAQVPAAARREPDKCLAPVWSREHDAFDWLVVDTHRDDDRPVARTIERRPQRQTHVPGVGAHEQ